ncbi:AAA family ATPase [Pseudoxanthomonas sp. PXM03]|uniref:SbcC/MukB-like Walker B domain-containing protein n=1 Tax=Pseudoxanthomonas sp. PXM03 TaxID=2769284 RepID=UPI001785F9C9|nr:SbcC/MukB-like Walker B domain-containing protein [Pseudoxanthomonas sp. PXM03]MBD9437324.1 AAA family ATPase [Pseudoxanthomonas sp. PXM03]
MKIERIIAINFGALSERDIELGQANLVVGKNGAGKSTLQDLIQIVLAGNDHNLIRLNPAQDADHKKSKRGLTKRSLAAYAVNMTDDGPGRPGGALCIIGLVFQPDPDEQAEPMTALWMAEVVPDQPGLTSRPHFRVKHEFGTLVRAGLSSLDLLQVDASGGWRVPALAQISDQLLASYPRGQVKGDLAKKAYVVSLQDWLSGGNIETGKEAERATKTFIQSIALKDISDVDTIVRDRVLDDMDLSADVQETASTLRQLELLQAEADRLASMDAILQRADQTGQEILERVKGVHVRQLAVAIRRHVQRRKDHNDAISALADCDVRLIKAEQSAAALEQSVHDLDLRVQDASLQVGSLPGMGEQRVLLSEAKEAQALRARSLASLHDDLAAAWASEVSGALARLPLTQFATIHEAWKGISPHATALGHASEQLRALTAHACRQVDDPVPVGEFHALALEHDSHLSLLQSSGRSSLTRLKQAAFTEATSLSAVMQTAQDAVGAAQQQLDKVSNGNIVLPRLIEEACAMLKHALPADARPRLLCHHVTPRFGTAWRPAIEGLLGGSRFTVLVEPAHEGDAHRHLRDWLALRPAHAKGGLQPTLAQTRRARDEAQRRPPVQASVLEELDIDDPLARDYLIAKYGSTVKVTDAKQLDTIASGLMVDGRVSKGFGRRIALLKKEECVFGADARRAQRAAIEAQLSQARGELDQASLQYEAVKFLATFEGDRQGRPIQALVADLERAEYKRIDVAHRTSALDGQSPEAKLAIARLEQQKRELTDMRARLVVEQEAVHKASSKKDKAQQDLDAMGSQLAEAASEQDQYRQRLVAAQAAVSPTLEEGAWEAEADQLSQHPLEAGDSLGTVAGHIAQRFQTMQADLDRYMERARDGEGLERVADVDSGAVWSRLIDIVQCIRSVERRRAWLTESSLRANAEEISKTKHKFASVLTDTLVQKILSRTKEIKFVIDTLNRPLRDLDFGTHKRYEVVYALKPEFADYLAFFAAVKEKSQDLSPEDQWFGQDVFTPEEQAIRERIKRDLLNAHSEAGRRALERISNAANYYEYDLAFETQAGTPVLYSEWGTGSGGESGTPPYILCGMLVANACGWFKGRGPRLRVLMLDEAFKVHDLERSNRVIEYLQRMGFQLIIAAQMDKASSILPNFTTTVSVARLAARIGNVRTWVSQIHVIGLNRDPLRALWQERRRQVAAAAEAEFRRLNPPPDQGQIALGVEG